VEFAYAELLTVAHLEEAIAHFVAVERLGQVLEAQFTLEVAAALDGIEAPASLLRGRGQRRGHGHLYLADERRDAPSVIRN